jgi:DNA invertase Pin-like site-specific DNA recombinase
MRASTDEQALSPDAQRAAIEAWAARHGVRVAAWHVEHVSGGAQLDDRPALLAALDALAEHRAGLLVVARRDRLARDAMLAAMIERLAERAGARVASAAGEGTDGDDPASLLLRRMIDAFAEYERALIRSRTKAALSVKRRRGERIGAVPYGYMLADDGRTLLEHEGEQAVIRCARELRRQGLSLADIAAVLDARGMRSRTGRTFAPSQVSRMLLEAA